MPLSESGSLSPDTPGPARYDAYGVTLASTIPLPELLPVDSAASPQLFATHVVASDDESRPAPIVPSDIGGVSIDRTADRVRLHFPGQVDFMLTDGCTQIECRPRPGVAGATIRHLLIDHVVPSALAGQGELVLHASGVSLPGGAVLFLGPSGAGKSTVAAVFARRGWPVLCDDGARLVEDGARFTLVPSYPGLRLWPDGVDVLVGAGQSLGEVAHESAKRRWVPDDRPPASLGLACVFVLHDMDDLVGIGPISPREALTETLDQSYRLPGSGPDAVRHQFDRIARLVTSYPFYRLTYPYDFSRLDEVADLVEAHVASIGVTAPAP